MNMSASMNQRLLWKETRQVIPLVIAIVVLAVLLSIWRTFWDAEVGSYLYQVIACIPPILFSLGVGTVLVGQEKETRSLNWLNSLPVSPKYLIRHQFLFALAGLATLWLAAFLVFLLIDRWSGQPSEWGDEFPTILLFVVVNSLYLLVCGFTTSWLIRSPVMGLISVLPLAVVPTIAAYVGQYLLAWLGGDPIHPVPDPSPWMTGTMLVLGIVGIGVFGYRIAQAQLTGQANRSPSRREQSWKASWQRLVTTVDDFFRGDSQTKQRPLSATGTLLWQFRNQNRSILFSLIAAFALCAPVAVPEVLYTGNLGSINTLLSAFCVVITFSSLCWIAILTFHGDQVNKRVQFFAERGVSPTRVWWTRQLVPALCVLVFGFVCIVSIRVHGQSEGWEVIFACGILYAVSQWLSQLIRPVAIVALLVPMASLFACIYAFVTIRELATSPLIVVTSLIVIPMLATWLMMRRWMDGRRGWSYWMTHAGLIVVAVVMPSFQYLRVWASFDGFSARQKTLLKLEATESVAEVPAYLDLRPAAEQHAYVAWEKIEDKQQQRAFRERAVDLELRHRESLAALKNGLDKLQRDRNQSVEMSPSLLQQYITAPTSLRMRMETGSKNDERSLSEYQDWMRTLPGLVSAMRNSLQLETQQAADFLEIFLLSELRNPKNAARIDDETRQAIVNVTSATDARWVARRRALIYSSKDILRADSRFALPEVLGGVRLSTNRDVDQNSYERLVHLRATEHLIKTLLEYIDEARRGNNDYPLEELVAYWDGAPGLYGEGPAGDYYRIDDVRKFTSSVAGGMPIASQWGAGWESTADIAPQTDADLEAN